MALQDDAFEVEALLLGESGSILIFGGTDEPQNVEPNAPVGSVYFRANGEIFRKLSVGNMFTNWEINDSGSGSGLNGYIPFFNANGTTDNIALTSGQIPFFNANGSQDNIGLV